MLTVQVLSIHCMGMTGAKGSTASSTSTISRATRVLTYRFNRRFHIAGGGTVSVCVKLSRWFLYLAKSVTLIIPPPLEDVFPFRETNENKCGVIDSEAMRMKFFLYYTSCATFIFRTAKRLVRLRLVFRGHAETVHRFFHASARGPPTLCELCVLENV